MPSPAVKPTLPAIEASDAEVKDRLRQARRAGRPQWLWPAVGPETWRSALVEIEGILRADLVGARLPTPRPEGTQDEAAFAVAAFTSGTGPLLGRWVEEGRLRIGPALSERLLLHLDHGRRRWQRATTLAERTAAILAEAGFPPILLKGVHTAPAFFPEPGCRPLSDVDVAVPPAAWDRACAALEQAGYALEKRQVRLGRAEFLPPGEGRSLRSLELLHADAPLRLDLHAGLDREVPGIGRLALGEPREGETEPWPSLHPDARVLAEPLLLATLASHASEEMHQLNLVRSWELARVVRTETARGALDWDALLVRVGRRSLRFLFPSLEIAERLAPGTVPARVRDTLRNEAPRLLRRVVARLTPATAQRFGGRSLEERVMWVGSPGELAGRLADLAWPASAGGSLSRVARIYVERLWRLAGRIS